MIISLLPSSDRARNQLCFPIFGKGGVIKKGSNCRDTASYKKGHARKYREMYTGFENIEVPCMVILMLSRNRFFTGNYHVMHVM